MTLKRSKGWFAIAVYVFGVFVVPQLHRLHHAAHGNDHVHTASGTVYFQLSDHDGDDHDHGDHDHDHNHDHDDDHGDHDHDDDHGDHDHDDHDHDDDHGDHDHAVDSGHSHDHHAPHPFDPEHGRNALEHMGVSWLAAKKIVVHAPVRALVQRRKPAPLIRISLAPRRSTCARAPPFSV